MQNSEFKIQKAFSGLPAFCILHSELHGFG